MLTVTVINPTDGDHHPIEFQYDWYVNSNLVQSNTISAISDTLDLSEPGLGNKGDDIWCIVTPLDVYDTGTPVTSSTATVANSAPTATDAEFSVVHGRQLSFVGPLVDLADDADGDTVSVSAINDDPDLVQHWFTTANGGSLLVYSNGYMCYNAPAAWTGTDTFDLTLTDGVASVTQHLTIHVTNIAPTIDDPGDQQSFCGDTVSFSLDVTDADDESLAYSATGLPDGLDIDAQDGTITGTIAGDADVNSPYFVTVTVFDGVIEVSRTFSWSVTVHEAIWSGNGDGLSWSDAANWEDEVVPGIYDYVIIDDPSTSTVIIGGNDVVTIRGITCSANLEVQGALTLTAGSSLITGEFELSGSLYLANTTNATLDGGGSLSGTLASDSETSLALTSGNFTVSNLQAEANQGVVIADGANNAVNMLIQVQGGVLPNSPVVLPNLEIRQGATIAGPGQLVVSTGLDWVGGTVNVPTTIHGSMVISGNVTLGADLYNYGNSGLTAGVTLSLSGATLHNFWVFGMEGQTTITQLGLAASSVVNEVVGTFNKIENGVATLELLFTNNGGVAVLEGELLAVSGTSNGENSIYNVSQGAVLHFRDRNHAFGPGAQVSGGGSFLVDNTELGGVAISTATLDLGQGASITVSRFTMQLVGSGFFGSQVIGTGVINCANFILSGCQVGAGTVVIVAGPAQMEIGRGAWLVGNATVLNLGTVTWSNGDMTMFDNASIVNDGSAFEGVFHINSGGNILDLTVIRANSTARIVATAGGEIKMGDNAGANTIQANLVNNNGTLDLNGKTLTLSRGPNAPAGLAPWDYAPINGNTWGGGRLNLDGNFVQTGGTTEVGYIAAQSFTLVSGQVGLAGGTIDVSAVAGSVNIGQTGVMQGGGNILGNLINAGTVSISNGAMQAYQFLNIFGDYTQTSTGVLIVTIAGTTPGTNADVLQAMTLTLDGILQIMLDNYDPTGGSFGVLNSGGIQGTFSQVVGLGNNFNWTTNYGANGDVTVQP